MGTNKYVKTEEQGISSILLLSAITLLIFSFIFALQRIIFTDTAVYAFHIITTQGFNVSTNRFVSVLSQLLPLAGVGLGLPLKTLIYLYSINCILIPLVAAALCYFTFKNAATALSVLLFYTIMNVWLFYYPVSEFQMGLCCLLVYHAFLTWYFKKEQPKPALFYGLSFFLIVIIAFSHPLSLYVLLAWLVWFLIDNPSGRKRIMLFPAAVGLLSNGAKELFFKKHEGSYVYDDARSEGLKNFKAPVSSYFDSVLSKTSLHAFTGDYYIILILAALLFVFFLLKKKWFAGFYFIGVLFLFWLLVTVSFRDYAYDHYPEHLYQPVPFFIALVFGKYVFALAKNTWIRTSVLSLIFCIAFAKIYSNNKYYTDRLDWYQHYIGLMHQKQIHNGALAPEHIDFGDKYSYWASMAESYLLSSLPGPDSTVRLIMLFDPKTIKTDWVPEPTSKTRYFLRVAEPHELLDSILPPETLEYKGPGSRYRIDNKQH